MKNRESLLTQVEIDQALIRAVQLRESLLVKACLTAGANPNFINVDGQSSLHLAAEHGLTDIAIILLKSGANPELRNKDDELAFEVAVKGRHAETYKILEQWLVKKRILSSDNVLATAYSQASDNGQLLRDEDTQDTIERIHRTCKLI